MPSIFVSGHALDSVIKTLDRAFIGWCGFMTSYLANGRFGNGIVLDDVPYSLRQLTRVLFCSRCVACVT